MKKLSLYLGVALLLITGVSCQKDYRLDGGKSQAFVNMTTYDYLKSNPLFDSLVRIIDHAGLKDEVNSSKTFFATTNYSAVGYVSAKRLKKIIETGSENIDFGIDDIPVDQIRDSLKLYMFDQEITRNNLTQDGDFYINKLPVQNDTIRYHIYLQRSFPHGEYLDYVDYVRFIKVIGELDRKRPANSPVQPSHQNDSDVLIQTSGIVTTTGVVHVMANTHRLMFNRENTGG
jgi:hypothetical protein